MLLIAGTSEIAAAANKITIMNRTGCDYVLSIAGSDGATVAAGATVTYESYSWVDISAIKIAYGSGVNYVQVNVGYGNPIANSAGQPTPPCIVGSYFEARWGQTLPTDNVLLDIY